MNRLLTLGALGVASTTALEILTAPYSDWVSLYPANGLVHVAKVVAVIAFLVGLARWRAGRDLGGAGTVATWLVTVGVACAALPYSVVEAVLPWSLPAAVAEARLEEWYDGPAAFVGALAAPALPVIVLGLVLLHVVALRRRLAPPWVPVLNLLCLPLAVAAGVLGQEGAGLPVPHPPTWLFLGLACYGLATARAHRPLAMATGR